MEKRKSNKTKSTYVAIAVLIFLLSAMLTAQIKVISKSDEVLQNKREEDLKSDYTSLKVEYDNLKKLSDEQRKIVEEYKNNSSTNDSLIKSLSDENNAYAALSGAKSVVGEGIVVVVDDSKKQPTDNLEQSSLVVHDSDLLALINELKASGAEAISINGNRVLSTTAIRSAGALIIVNDNKIGPPFEIKAIGNSQYLESAINLKGGVADSLKSSYGIQIKVEREKQIVIEKYSKTLNFKYATIYNK
ncbi:MAG: DUF881 domain-containing protein [Clostridia bacterium]